MRERYAIDDRLRSAVAEGAAPALAFAVDQGGHRQTWFAGDLGPMPGGAPAPPCDAQTRFDLASLTKPLTTVPWVLRLVSEGRLDLLAPLGDALPGLEGPLARCPLWRLLTHTSGLAAHRPFFQGLAGTVGTAEGAARAKAAVRRMIAGAPLPSAPGAEERYSDLGFLLLEWAAERADAPLAARWPDLPGHGTGRLHFRPRPGPPPTAPYAPTERCPWRGTLLRGEVHDDNAWVIGGVAGHAGLFGTLDATVDAARAWLDAVRGDVALPGVDLAYTTSVLAPKWGHPQGTFQLGWDTPTPGGGSTAGTQFGRRALGHLGFTGTSIWMDVDANVVMVLLSNRVSPTRENQRHRPLRPALHDLGWAWARANRPA